ncbi:MAG: ATP-binding protein, partial [Polyangiaceae bacterium]
MLHASSDLVGRDTEKADLHSAYHQAVVGGGAGGAVTCRAVVGEMGIGKTALVSTFIAELPPNTRVVRVECSPVKLEVPFNAVAELVRDTLGLTGEEPFEDVVNILARAGGGSAQGDATHPMLARMAELATNKPLGGGGDDDPHYLRKMLTTGLRMLLAAIAMEQPLVVLVEGLQWADKQSQEVLTEILKIGDPLPILILLLSRQDDRTLTPLEGVMRIELRGLSADEQVRLVETRLGVREGVRQVCADMLPRVGGNPFFLLEMVDALLERGTLEIREEIDGENGETRHILARTDRADANLSLPSTLEQLLGDRLRELPDEEHAIVDWLAIAGGPLSVHDLAELTHFGTNEAIMRLCARGLCDRRAEHIDFRHPLTRDVAYLALDTTDRVAMHRALGTHLGKTALGRGISAAIVARHLARGDAGPAAATFYLEAADAARIGNQTQLAVRYLNRALACLPATDSRRLHAHEALETIFRVLGRRRDRIRHLDALRQVARRAA